MRLKSILKISLLAITISSCSEDTDLSTLDNDDIGVVEDVIENPGNIQEVTALPLSVNYPVGNPQSTSKEELGRLLFWDPVLSGTMEVSCATCHHPDFAYADGIERSIGVGGVGIGPGRTGGTLIDRNSPTILNTAFNGMGLTADYDPSQAEMFWDNRVRSLETQSIQPILSAVEMRGDEIFYLMFVFPFYVARLEVIFNKDCISSMIEDKVSDIKANFFKCFGLALY